MFLIKEIKYEARLFLFLKLLSILFVDFCLWFLAILFDKFRFFSWWLYVAFFFFISCNFLNQADIDAFLQITDTKLRLTKQQNSNKQTNKQKCKH